MLFKDVSTNMEERMKDVREAIMAFMGNFTKTMTAPAVFLCKVISIKSLCSFSLPQISLICH